MGVVPLGFTRSLVVLWYCMWYLVPNSTAQYISGQGPEVTLDRFMCYRTPIFGNLMLDIVGKTKEKSILRVWSAQLSAQVCLVAFAKCWSVRYRHDCRAGLNISPAE